MDQVATLLTGWEPGTPLDDSILRQFVFACADRVACMARATGGRVDRDTAACIADVGSAFGYDNAAVLLQPPAPPSARRLRRRSAGRHRRGLRDQRRRRDRLGRDPAHPPPARHRGGHDHGRRLESFTKQFVGEVIGPGDDGYEEHHRGWNGMIDKHPALIARCRSRDDVVSTVTFARERGLLLAVRGLAVVG